MNKILFLVNPTSGTLRAHSALFDLIDCFCKAGIEPSTVITQYPGHAAQLAAGAADRGFDALVCCGGDGTLNEAVSGVLRGGRSLPLGYIPAGSTNDFARTLELPTEPVRAAQELLNGSLMPLDIGKFGKDRYFCYIASFGAFTAASYSATTEMKNTFGHFAYLIEGLKDLPNIRAHRVKVRTEDREISGSFIFGSVSNTKSVGGVVKLSDEHTHISLNDGLFEVTLVREPQNPLDLNKIVTGIAAGDFSSDMFEFFKADRVEFTLGKTIPWTLDGEKASTDGTVVIENLHDAIRILK